MKHWHKQSFLNEDDEANAYAIEYSITIGDIDFMVSFSCCEPDNKGTYIYLDAYDRITTESFVDKEYNVEASVESAANRFVYYASRLLNMARKSVEADYKRKHKALDQLSSIPLTTT